MKLYRLGFVWQGLLAFMLVMIPNLLWAFFPPTPDVLAANEAPFAWVEVLMKASQFLMVALMVFVAHQNGFNRKMQKPLCLCAGVCLLCYDAAWAFYFAGATPALLFVSMAIVPSVYFMLVCCWLRNYPALLCAGVFGVLHTVVTCVNFM